VGFLELSPDLYEKFIVKLNVIRNTKDDLHGDNYVFVFSRCIDDSSNYGRVLIELVPERNVPNFHENLKNEERIEVKDHDFDENESDGTKAVSIGESIKIIKSKGEFETQYVAVVEEEQASQAKYYLLLTKNRGFRGKFEEFPYTHYPLHFEIKKMEYKAEQKIDKIDSSIEYVKEVEGIDEWIEEVVHRMEKQKADTEQLKGEYLRSFSSEKHK
jgi:hypothetical protein